MTSHKETEPRGHLQPRDSPAAQLGPLGQCVEPPGTLGDLQCCLTAGGTLISILRPPQDCTQDDDNFPLEGFKGQNMGEKGQTASYGIHKLLMFSVLEKPLDPVYAQDQGSMVGADSRTVESDQKQILRGATSGRLVF